jgi:hypothetical protein
LHDLSWRAVVLALDGAVRAIGLHLEEVEGPAASVDLEEGAQFPGASERPEVLADGTEPLFAQQDAWLFALQRFRDLTTAPGVVAARGKGE